MKLKKSIPGLAMALAMLLPSAASAHGSMIPQHGGVVQMSGEIMIELVSAPKGLEFYVSEEDQPIPAKDFDAKLILTAANGTKSNAVLKPMAGNKFVAPGLKPPAQTKVVVALVNKADSAKTFITFRMK